MVLTPDPYPDPDPDSNPELDWEGLLIIILWTKGFTIEGFIVTYFNITTTLVILSIRVFNKCKKSFSLCIFSNKGDLKKSQTKLQLI